jgi:hypothetical protein
MDESDAQISGLGRSGENITIQFSHLRRNRAIAKLIVVIGLGLALSPYYGSTLVKQRERALNLTQDSYMADFANYKARLLEGTRVPPIAVPFAMILAIAIMAGTYELLVFLVAWLIGKVLKS